MALNEFRLGVRSWLEENCPSEMREPVRCEGDVCWGGRDAHFQSPAQKQWLERMAARGWTVPTWPSEYGGGGLTAEQAAILKEEMKRIHARAPLHSFGIWMLGPALLKYGNEAQKREHLPTIARGEVRWCQGYSEPNAGSDLASLQTRAERHVDHYLVNGQKIWTSYADKADWIFCLVRTSTEGRKQEGISFLLFDMRTPGVSTRPITLISGASQFCETFFDDVCVPRGNLVGELNRGWDIAKYLLTHERENLGEDGGIAPTDYLPGAESARRARSGDAVSSVLRAATANAHVDYFAYLLTSQRARDEGVSGAGAGAAASQLKYAGSELNKRMYSIMMEIQGSTALEWSESNSENGKTVRAWLRSKGNSIEGGTSEIQLGIIARHVFSGGARR